MRMRAAILREMGKARPYHTSQPLGIEQVELDPPGPGEVLVRIAAAGLCHSDLSVINGDRPRQLPMVLGHEASGEIIERGSGVSDVGPGDRVIFVFVPSCGNCLPCAEGRPALCEPAAEANGAGRLIGGHTRLHQAGAPMFHHVGVSAFAEYAVVSRRSVVPIDDDLDLAEAALFGCAVLTGAGAVVNTAKVPPGASVAIVGLGGVGLMALLAARLSGADQVIAVDRVEAKLQLARQMGASLGVDARDPDCVNKVRAATGGGADFAFEMASSAPALELAYAITRRGGTTITASLPHPDARMALPATNLVAEERTLKGSYIGSCVPVRDIPRFISLYRRGLMPIDQVMSERIGFDGINAAFDRLADGVSVRQILIPEQNS